MSDNHYKGLKVNILLLGLVSFLNDLSSEMVMPILPLFITSLGGAGLIVGLIGGLRDSISSVLKLFAGYWSDKLAKRKIFVASGYLISALFKLFLSFSKIWPHILIFSSLERIGKGLRTAPRDAIIADSLPEKRGRGFGIHSAMDTLGAVVGSVIVFLLFWFWGFSFKSIIFIAGILALFSLIPLHFVKERPGEPQKDISLKLSLKSLPQPLRYFILISSLFALANFSYMFFILKAQGFFTGRLSIGGPIFLYILFNIFYSVFVFPFGKLSDRVGRRKVIILGYLLFSFTSFGFAVSNSLINFIILFAFYGIVYAIVDANQRAYISDLSSDELRATALGTFHTMIGLAALPASLIAGALWQINPNITFIYGGLISIISALLFVVLKVHSKAAGIRL